MLEGEKSLFVCIVLWFFFFFFLNHTKAPHPSSCNLGQKASGEVIWHTKKSHHIQMF